MTIDEVIEHAEEIAEEKFNNAVYIMDKMKSDVALKNAEECKRFSEEHRQLAEWLKDYKRLKEQEPCEDAISKQAVIDTIIAECSGTKLDIDFAKVLIIQRAIKALPPVTPQPKMGHWIDTVSGQECSECREIQYGYDNFRHFCANCGARMDWSQESEIKDEDTN